ncbi:MAG: protein translocase subunit SecF [Hyphomicrobiaceae bacterium]|nr:protein translocase subunit SecF [Hyphomicrobiaceae bacterium]
MKGLDFIPHNTKVPFLSWRTIAMVFSTIGVLASIVLFLAQGLNLGIDFRGGSLIEVKSRSGAIDVGWLRTQVGELKLGDVQVQKIQDFSGQSQCSDNSCAMLRIELQPGGDKVQQATLERVKEKLGDRVIYRSTEVVGPTVQGELVQTGIEAVFGAILAVLIYIWFRFEWQFALGAVAALVHDVLLTIGIFSLLQIEFGLPVVAAILTIVGYSLNDTVVVFDRIRENLRKYKKKDLAELLDLSINETLSRTILTSVTTLLALLSLYIFGGEVIRGFTFAMIWGVIVGTYSSVFIASPILLMLGVTRDWSGTVSSRKEQQKAG